MTRVATCPIARPRVPARQHAGRWAVRCIALRHGHRASSAARNSSQNVAVGPDAHCCCGTRLCLVGVQEAGCSFHKLGMASDYNRSNQFDDFHLLPHFLLTLKPLQGVY